MKRKKSQTILFFTYITHIHLPFIIEIIVRLGHDTAANEKKWPERQRSASKI